MNTIYNYIDRCLLDEYAVCEDFNYSLDVDSLSEHEISNFLDLLMREDTSVRDFVLCQMQKMINERIPSFGGKKLRDKGYRSRIDHITGETIWERSCA